MVGCRGKTFYWFRVVFIVMEEPARGAAEGETEGEKMKEKTPKNERKEAFWF